MRPPVVARTTRDFSAPPPASKIGKITDTSSTSIETTGSDPVRNPPTIAGEEREGEGRAGDGHPQRDQPVGRRRCLAQQRRPNNRDQVIERIEIGKHYVVRELLRAPHDRRNEK